MQYNILIAVFSIQYKVVSFAALGMTDSCSIALDISNFPQSRLCIADVGAKPYYYNKLQLLLSLYIGKRVFTKIIDLVPSHHDIPALNYF